MCGAICDCLKGSGKVVCCCCQCALSLCLGLICTVLVLGLIIGLIVYFAVYHNKDSSADKKMLEELVTAAPLTFRGFFQ
ncbi:protein midgut expression 1-like [Ceratitis capitata]|uniref:protein midgut expression 1-like n=1 Tax=Ceratitis capitata TaxID=7213 RepID=UPI00032A246A|nr:protein midgut expression 1-like [Ceratitis capitata]XP_020713323.1 protein midgut expression 1-like [Ceratitis capitata]